MQISSKGKSLVTIPTEPTMTYAAFFKLYFKITIRDSKAYLSFLNPAAFVLYTHSLKYLGGDGKQHCLLTLH